MHNNRALALIALMLSSPVMASDWQYLASVGDDGSFVSLDAESKAVSGTFKKAWFKWVHANDKPLSESLRSEPASSAYKSSVELGYFNCAERSSANIQAIYYDKENKVVGGYTVNVKDAKWSEVAPDTIGETMLNEICKKATPAQKTKAGQ